MTTSDWGDWLIREIEDAEPAGVAIWYLGCNGFVCKGRSGTIIYIDPYVGLGDPPRTVRMIPVPFDPTDVQKADAILATHEHTDHVHGPSQAPILASTDARFVGPSDSISVALEDEAWPTNWDVSSSQFETVDVGDRVEIDEFEISVEAANDPDATEPVSYVIEHDAGTFFHGGDSKPAAEFDRLGREYDIDVGILAFGTVGNVPDKETGEPTSTRWYNDENQVIEAASSLQLDRLVPSHWDMWRGLTGDPKALHTHANSYQFPRRLDLVEIGDRIDL